MLFDLDGTITDPEVGITGSFRHALDAVGHPVADDADLRWVIGPSIAESLDRFGLPAELHDEVVARYRARLRDVGLAQAVLHDGMVDVLDALRSDGVRLALASAKMIDMGEATLEQFGLLDRFDLVAGTLADGLPRTKAQIVAGALAGLGHPDPATVAMVGDRRHDVEGARANGCIAVAVSWGFAAPDEHDPLPPDHHVASPAELLDRLRALP
ncbi:MAG: HAD hydrolase-like protein [Acidimicrobiales bacterium]